MNDELDLLENEIEGDWSIIREKFHEKELKEERKQFVYPKIPSFKEFIKLMHEIYVASASDRDKNEYIAYIAQFFLSKQEDFFATESFSNIWDIFTRRKYGSIVQFDCPECKGSFDVIFQHLSFAEYSSSLHNIHQSSNMKRYHYLCPKCGRYIFELTGNMIAIFNRRGVHDT